MISTIAVGCAAPTAPASSGPTLVCPAPPPAISLDGNAIPVLYDLPQIVGGQPPVTTTCSPPSGSTFPLGTSTVTCNALDAVARTASCSFIVTVALPPRLAATSFMAFGNSITEGKTAVSTEIAHPYPSLLNALLAVRYAGQVITVVNKGLGGERAVDGSDRLKVELDAVHPAVVLLEEGINDLSDGNPMKIGILIDALRDMVRKAKTRGVIVFLATLLPTRAGGTPPRGTNALPLIPDANAQIRLLAASEDVTLVDLYAGFGGTPDPYIDVDGLHPTQDGYQKIADLFFQAIKTRLEVPSSPASITLVRNMLSP